MNTKTNRTRTGRAILIFALLIIAGITACDNDPITETRGKPIDKSAMGQIGSTMRGSLSFSGKAEVVLTAPDEGEEPQTVTADQLVFTLAKPLQSETKATLSSGNKLTPDFLAEVKRINAKIDEINPSLGMHSVRHKIPALFPAGNVQWETGTLTVPAGKTTSQEVSLSLSNKGLSPDTLYLLPLVVEQTGNDGKTRQQILQYMVKVYAKKLKWTNTWSLLPEVTLDTDFMTVFYVNTETYQPLIADVFMYAKINQTTQETEKACSFGNIVNLRPAVVGYDAAANRALFKQGPDLRYVLEHAEKYIRPLQNHGRKVCICIQGGGKGIGFCNMTDAQIADFTAQVKDVLTLYKLDGINLWDEGSQYGKKGMPAMNTSSYPKLIKSLREALPDKLLTLVDKDQPTEYFHDAAQCGGIEVGKYIDYAWSGYFSEKEIVQIIEPWATDHPYSEVTRRPIAGLPPQRYGSLNMPRYSHNVSVEISETISPKRVVEWKTADRKKNNIIVFGFDLTANEQTQYEGQPHLGAFSYLSYLADDGNIWGQNPYTGEWQIISGKYWYWTRSTDPAYSGGYGLYKKDW